MVQFVTNLGSIQWVNYYYGLIQFNIPQKVDCLISNKEFEVNFTPHKPLMIASTSLAPRSCLNFRLSSFES